MYLYKWSWSVYWSRHGRTSVEYFQSVKYTQNTDPVGAVAGINKASTTPTIRSAVEDRMGISVRNGTHVPARQSW